MLTVKTKRHEREHGTIVVLMALGVVLVLMFAGLAIDGSNAYVQHRRMQNAADAGALAGARCLAQPYVTNESVLSAVQRFAEENGAPKSRLRVEYVSNDSRLGTVESYGLSYPPPQEATGVYVLASVNYKLFFGGIFGLRQKTSSAEAVARVGATRALDTTSFL